MRSPTQEVMSFSGPLVRSEILRDAQDHFIAGRAVVVNMSGNDAYIGGQKRSALPGLSSTILLDGSVTGSLLGVFFVLETSEPPEAVTRELEWTDFYGPGDSHPVLLRSKQETVGVVTLDKEKVLHQPGLGASDFELKANLWFSPAGTDCGIHNEHAFIEVHSQISGIGRMQKFGKKDHESLYEDQILAPGTTNPTPFCVEESGRFSYPWHQYRADTDCIWLALEYHQL